MRLWPWARSMKTRVVSPSSRLSCGVKVPRTSSMLAKALMMSETGEVTLFFVPASSVHCVRMLSESLPTGMLMFSAGHSSIPTVLTVAYSAASSPASPQAAIQLADSLTLASSIGAANRLVMASATAIRPEAGALKMASGVRSPMAMASPAKPARSASVTAQSATGTCQGPTIWSRCVRPPTVRSPMVMRKRLLATVGWLKTLITLSCKSTPVRSMAWNWRFKVVTSRCILGVLPSNTFIGISTGLPSPGGRGSEEGVVCALEVSDGVGLSLPRPCGERAGVRGACDTTNSRSCVVTPTTANGQRSRSQKLLNSASDSGAMAIT